MNAARQLAQGNMTAGRADDGKVLLRDNNIGVGFTRLSEGAWRALAVAALAHRQSAKVQRKDGQIAHPMHPTQKAPDYIRGLCCSGLMRVDFVPV